MEKSFRCLLSSSALNLLEGLPVFQIWHECRQRFGDTNLAKKIDVRFFCFRLRRLKTLVLKNHFVSEVVPFVRYCYMYRKAKSVSRWGRVGMLLHVLIINPNYTRTYHNI